MNFDDYMKKIQYISSILEKNEYAENVLNSKELDIAQDFQYICLSSAANYKLVNEIIARLAQNGNADIVKENVKMRLLKKYLLRIIITYLKTVQ